MNKAFRIIWSHSRQAFVVTDELASTSSKRSGARLLLAAASAGLLLTSQVGVAQAADVCSGGTTIINSTNSGSTCQLASGASLTVEAGGSIRSPGNTVSTSDNTAIDTIINGGTIAGDIGISLSGDNGAPSTGVAITNQVDATVSGEVNGIAIFDNFTLGRLSNAGTINADYLYGIYVTGTISGDLRNETGAVIEGGEGGIYVSGNIGGSIVNAGQISGDTYGIQIESGEVGTINNSGSIVGGDFGIQIGSQYYGEIGSLSNSGTIQGNRYAIQLGSGSFNSLYIEGNNSAKFVGDVDARKANVLVKSGAVFSSTNAFEVKSFAIEQNATLNMGSGTSSSGDLAEGFTVRNGFTNNGTLALASGVTGSIHGDYTQSASGTLKIGVADNTTFGKLVVDGTAELASNAKIAVNVSNPNYSFSVASLQDVLSATSLNSDGSFAVSDNSLLFDFGAVKDGNTVDLTISAAANPSNGLIEDIVTGLGNTPAVGAAKVLDKVIAGKPSGELAGHFVGLSNQQQVSDAVSSTLPTVAGSTSNAIGDTLSGVNRVVQARQAGNSGLSSGDAVTDDNLWIKTSGAWAEQDERNAISGYDANTQGLAIGSDAAISEHSRLGLAFAYAQTNLDSDSHTAPQSADIDTFQLIGYGSHTLDANTELNFQLDGGQNRVSSTRHMPFANATAKADYDGYNLHAGAGIGHSLRLSEQLTFIPRHAPTTPGLRVRAYREKGAGALNLDVDSNDAEELLMSVDGKLDYQLSAATVASANLGAGYDVIDEDSAIASTYAGAPGAAFKTTGMDLEPWLARAGLGLSHTLPSGTEVSLRYDAEVRSDFTNQGASLKARWAF